MISSTLAVKSKTPHQHAIGVLRSGTGQVGERAEISLSRRLEHEGKSPFFLDALNSFIQIPEAKRSRVGFRDLPMRGEVSKTKSLSTIRIGQDRSKILANKVVLVSCTWIIGRNKLDKDHLRLRRSACVAVTVLMDKSLYRKRRRRSRAKSGIPSLPRGSRPRCPSPDGGGRRILLLHLRRRGPGKSFWGCRPLRDEATWSILFCRRGPRRHRWQRYEL